MLNAFRHQRRKRGHSTVPARRDAHSAQRLPASAKETLTNRVLDKLNHWCSTPSGISEGNAAIEHITNIHKSYGCSTPSGISEGNAWNIRDFIIERSMCSTPSGISEGNASPSLCTDELDVSAQRLPASAKETHYRTNLFYGRLHVLNAFRHQRRKRRCGPVSWNGRSIVLNAFRHQRRKRASICSTGWRWPVVLNAFRHQRRKRIASSLRLQFSATACSTPSGISEGNARSSWSLLHGGLAVLNAFRHQRRKRVASTSVVRRPAMCSTPSGISEGNALQNEPVLRSSSRAQRLPASAKETRADTRHRKAPFRKVLNAFRHQRRKRGGGNGGRLAM